MLGVFVVFVILGFELRASRLLGKHYHLSHPISPTFYLWSVLLHSHVSQLSELLHTYSFSFLVSFDMCKPAPNVCYAVVCYFCLLNLLDDLLNNFVKLHPLCILWIFICNYIDAMN
jgi:hypothetical protein